MTGDRVWRMPLYQQYTKQIEARTADISNVGARGRYIHSVKNAGLKLAENAK